MNAFLGGLSQCLHCSCFMLWLQRELNTSML